MQIHFLRNATFILQNHDHHILVDPMLGKRGHLPPYSIFRHPLRRNPLVDLPANATSALKNVTTCLITHCRFGHFDHLDKAGAEFLRKRQIQVYGNHLDANYLIKKGINFTPIKLKQTIDFCSGTLTSVKTEHGYGWIGKMMGPGMGYIVRLPNAPSLYISGDTVLTDSVRQVLCDEKPDIAIVAAGGASLDVGKPILMPMAELLEFGQLAPQHVVAIHMEALNHCPITRTELRIEYEKAGLSERLFIPEDGEILEF